MSQQAKSGGVPYIVKALFGVLFMGGGYFLSVHADEYLGFQKKLAAQGVPIDLGITLAVIGVLLILFPVIQSFYLVPLQSAIDERNEDLERTFAEVEELRASMAQMKTDYEGRLAETEAKAREQIQQSIKEAQQLRQTLMAEATDRADQMVRQAEAEIEAEKAQALVEIRTSVVSLALTAAQKVVGESMDSDKNRKLVTQFIDELEVSRS